MAQQEDGWPLGLQPLHMRVGLVRNRDFSGSISFSTFITASPSFSSASSSDLDTESTGSFFPDKSTTLGNLIGVSSILDHPARSVRGKRPDFVDYKKNYRSKKWFSLCTKACACSNSPANPPSLGHLLEAERKAANGYRRNQNSFGYEHEQFPEVQLSSEPNSLFMDGQIAPPREGIDEKEISAQWIGSDIERKSNRNHSQANAVPMLFSCVCGQPTN